MCAPPSASWKKQQAGVEIQGRKFGIDIVMEAPDRFTDTVRDAFESESLTFLPTIFRSRFHFAEMMRPGDIVQLLDRIRLRGTDGVVLKAPDVAEISAAVARLEQSGIPVVTLVTDLPNAPRTAYAGADNRAAGENRCLSDRRTFLGPAGDGAGHPVEQPVPGRRRTRNRLSPHLARPLSVDRHRRNQRGSRPRTMRRALW